MTGDALVLVGYRGSGKSTVGQVVAARRGCPFVDADAVIETEARRTIAVLFAADGEESFRDLEQLTLAGLLTGPVRVVATGGGCVLRPSTRALLKQAGLVVWLQADAETLAARIAADLDSAERRPNLSVGGLAEVREMLAIRTPLYRECAGLTLDARQSPEQLADAILAAWIPRPH